MDATQLGPAPPSLVSCLSGASTNPAWCKYVPVVDVDEGRGTPVPGGRAEGGEGAWRRWRPTAEVVCEGLLVVGALTQGLSLSSGRPFPGARGAEGELPPPYLAPPSCHCHSRCVYKRHACKAHRQTKQTRTLHRVEFTRPIQHQHAHTDTHKSVCHPFAPRRNTAKKLNSRDRMQLSRPAPCRAATAGRRSCSVAVAMSRPSSGEKTNALS